MSRFYTMKIQEGADGIDNKDRIKALIQTKGVVVWGEASNVSCKQGDYLVVRAERKTLCLLKVLSSKEEGFDCGDEFTDFAWAAYAKHVEVLSWFDEDQGRFQLPDFDWRGWMQTCSEVQNQDRLEQLQNWLQKICEVKMTSDLSTLLKNTYNLILTGAPGTGKTYLAWQIACSMTSDPNPMEKGNENLAHPHIGFCQFHPSMDYTDFVEGIRPIKQNDENEYISFDGKDGIFKDFCRQAAQAQKANKGEKYVFIIDEVNRGDISKIFGELFFAVDPGYRGEKGRITTQYANLIDHKKDNSNVDNVFRNGFYVPDNVYIIGTMNDIDRGVESMDFAIRRRFAWREITPEETQTAIFASKDNLKNNAGVHNRMNNLNAVICNELGPAFQIGAAYFTKLDGDNYEALWQNHLEPLLREYLRGHDKNVIKKKIDIFKAEFDNATEKTSNETNSVEES